MTNPFIDLITQRRSIYAIGNTVAYDLETLTEMIQNAIKQSPSSFNSQSSRAVILFHAEHKKFWEFVAQKLQDYAKDEQSAVKTRTKMDSFAGGIGTILFFEDISVIQRLQEQFPAYAENFPIWSEHSTAMAQFATWTALHASGLGASLQHYNPIVDEQVHTEWNVPSDWKLSAQLVFGSIEAEAKEKTFMDDGLRFKVFNS